MKVEIKIEVESHGERVPVAIRHVARGVIAISVAGRDLILFNRAEALQFSRAFAAVQLEMVEADGDGV